LLFFCHRGCKYFSRAFAREKALAVLLALGMAISTCRMWDASETSQFKKIWMNKALAYMHGTFHPTGASSRTFNPGSSSTIIFAEINP